jgi:hypothetical protein
MKHASASDLSSEDESSDSELGMSRSFADIFGNPEDWGPVPEETAQKCVHVECVDSFLGALLMYINEGQPFQIELIPRLRKSVMDAIAKKYECKLSADNISYLAETFVKFICKNMCVVVDERNYRFKVMISVIQKNDCDQGILEALEELMRRFMMLEFALVLEICKFFNACSTNGKNEFSLDTLRQIDLANAALLSEPSAVLDEAL